ncbi:MAG: phosphoglucosamine mutase [Blastocatellia bacterium]|nr:phosphoglucosamine mutase [Blastocatellia bacterium]
MKKYFGTDGIRCVAGEFPLQHHALNALGAALVRELSNRNGAFPRIVLGGDTRESTEWIAGALAWGIRTEGGTVAWAGVIPTPGIAYLTNSLGFDAGVVISASHNPFQDNGIKIFFPSGQKQDDALETALEAALAGLTPETDPEAASALELKSDDTLSARYIEFLSSHIGKGLNLSKLKLAVDCANGAASFYAGIVFGSLGAQTYLRAAEPDGKNINRDCGSLHLERLSAFVREIEADLGLAFDGDADRCLLVDRHGTVVDGDAMLFVLANHLQETKQLTPSSIVATVMSNLGLELALRERGVELLRASVGDRFVLEELLKTGAKVGGEQSGHLIFPHISLAGDGMLTALQVLRVLVESGKSLDELTGGLKTCPQVLVNVRVREKLPFADVPAIAAAAAAIEAHFAGRGRLLLRYSGTEKLARVMIEGEDLNDVTAQANHLADIIRAEIGEAQ